MEGSVEIENESNMGLVLRLKTEFIDFDPLSPHDANNDRSKTGTGFLLEIDGDIVIVTAHHVISNFKSVLATTQRANRGETMQ